MNDIDGFKSSHYLVVCHYFHHLLAGFHQGYLQKSIKINRNTSTRRQTITTLTLPHPQPT